MPVRYPASLARLVACAMVCFALPSTAHQPVFGRSEEIIPLDCAVINRKLADYRTAWLSVLPKFGARPRTLWYLAHSESLDDFDAVVSTLDFGVHGMVAVMHLSADGQRLKPFTRFCKA